MSVATLATAWTLTHDFVGSTIIGATTREQLNDTLAAADVTLVGGRPQGLPPGDEGDPLPDGVSHAPTRPSRQPRKTGPQGKR